MRRRLDRVLRKDAKTRRGMRIEFGPIEVEMLKVLLRGVAQSENRRVSPK